MHDVRYKATVQDDVNRRWFLNNRPRGWPTREDFTLEETAIPVPGPGEILLRCVWLSVDPYMRGRMRKRPGYAPPQAVGETMLGGAVARVVASTDGRFEPGTLVQYDHFGWQDYCAAPAGALRKLDPAGPPASAALGAWGMPGATAYFGIFDILQPKPGDTVVVSAGAGAVGSIAGQLAKRAGCRVIGVVGRPEKVAWLTEELGFDAAIDRQREDLGERIDALCPDGVHGYFDNVGGEVTDAVLPRLARGATVALCGQISQYNDTRVTEGPRLLWTLIGKRARIQGFLVLDYADRLPEAHTRLGSWLLDGSLQTRETVRNGLEAAPDAFLDMMRGDNVGKMLVRIRD